MATGYNFGGWYTDSACTSAYDFTTRVTSDITLYAKWTIAAAPVNTKLTDTSDSNGTYTVISDSNGTYTVISDSDGSASVKFTAQKKKTEKVTIPSAVTDENGITYKVTSIAANAFKGNKKIKKLTIPETVTTIEKCAFKNCKNLKKITFNGDSLKSVCKNSLKGINKNAKIYIRTNDKKTFKKIKKMLKKAGAKNVTFKQIKT
ncbi:MAG: leucine-rich repeat protein [Butyrivibrio sp.]|nr:leucine-rich repeat protein [Butyrivibrio sp.]